MDCARKSKKCVRVRDHENATARAQDTQIVQGVHTAIRVFSSDTRMVGDTSSEKEESSIVLTRTLMVAPPAPEAASSPWLAMVWVCWPLLNVTASTNLNLAVLYNSK